jgi:hypothetical protein
MDRGAGGCISWFPIFCGGSGGNGLFAAFSRRLFGASLTLACVWHCSVRVNEYSIGWRCSVSLPCKHV